MNAPRYSYQAINALSLNDTGHFVYLDAWSVSLLGSMLSQERPFYLWANDQNPLSVGEIDDLDDKLSTAQGQLMTPLVGLIMPICSQSSPQGTLLCDGSTYLRVDYPNLYAVLDSAFIIDADTFRVPDMTDSFVMGFSSTHIVGSTGGNAEITQTTGQMPTHTHTNTPHAHSEIGAVNVIINGGLEAPASAAQPFPTSTGLTSISIDTAGSSEPMDITPPFIALKYVVVAL